MNKKVLVVEDQDNLRNLVDVFLSKNFEVVSARNGLEAMSWLSGGMIPDIIVTGDRMPELSGGQLAYHLRCSGLFSDIPVVMISDKKDEAELLRCRQMGVAEVMHKPLNMFALETRLKQLLQPEQSLEA